MINSLKAAIQYAKNIRTTGAMTETSRWVEREVTQHVNAKVAQIFVEFGGGHGNITREILKKMHPHSRLYVFEINSDFCEVLRRIDDSRLVVIQEPAEKVAEFVNEQQVDGIVSSIPVTFLSDEERDETLRQSHDLLKEGAYMMQVLYSTSSPEAFQTFFSGMFDETGV